MTKKAQTIFTVCFVAFLISVVSLSFVFADSIPHNTETPQITGGYLFSFDVRCVDEDGNLLKNVSFLENGTAWAVDVPEIDGFTPGSETVKEQRSTAGSGICAATSAEAERNFIAPGLRETIPS